MSDMEDLNQNSFKEMESAVDIKYDENDIIKDENRDNSNDHSFYPEDRPDNSDKIQMDGPSGESSTDEPGNSKNEELSENNNGNELTEGTDLYEMQNMVSKTEEDEDYGAGFVNLAFEANENKATTKHEKDIDTELKDTANYGDDNTKNSGFSFDGDRVDNEETAMYGQDAVDTEEESDDDLDATIKLNSNNDNRGGEKSNSPDSRDSGNSNQSKNDNISTNNKQDNKDVNSAKLNGSYTDQPTLNQSANNQGRSASDSTLTGSENYLSGTGNEIAQDDDVKIELPEETDDISYKNDKKEDEEDENDGYNYEDEDIWALPEFKSEEKPWSDLTRKEKIIKVLWHYIGKGILLIFLLYIFICSLSFLGDAFKLLGGKAAGKAFTNVDILSNRLAGVIIGVLATVLLQSSSTTTSIVVSMVGSGSLLTVRQAIPIIMGANIGTTITNTIVAIGQINHKEDFRRAFAGATVHDVFNWLNVLVMLLLEEIFGYLEALTGAIVKNFEPGETSGSDNDYLKALTDPFTKLIIQIDKAVITRIAIGNITGDGQSIIKHKCGNSTCKFMFEHVSSQDGGGWSDEAVGVILLLISLFLLCLCLILIVKILHSLLKGHIAKWIRKFINANLPGKLSYFTGYIALLIGAGITILVQSSSIFTSSLTPLVGMGVLRLDRMYPLTLGSNIGTTGTGIIAAFAQDPNQMKDALQIALCHLFFNITGILIFYPIPFMRLPIRAAKFLGIRSAEYRWFAILYIIFPYFVLPALGLGLSLIHIALLITVLVLVAVLVLVIVVIKSLQVKFPRFLPQKFRDWKWLPEWMRSLEPTDRLIQRVLKRLGRLKLFIYCRKHCPCKKCKSGDPGD